MVLGRFVRTAIWKRDQYERVVGSVFVRKWWGGKMDVSLEMLRRGLATVYEAKFGSEFGNREEAYRAAEAKAKRDGVGLWGGQRELGLLDRLVGRKKEVLETPRQYKDRMNAAEKGQAGLKK